MRRTRVESAQLNDGVSTARIPLVARRHRVELPSAIEEVCAYRLAERGASSGSEKRATA